MRADHDYVRAAAFRGPNDLFVSGAAKQKPCHFDLRPLDFIDKLLERRTRLLLRAAVELDIKRRVGVAVDGIGDIRHDDMNEQKLGAVLLGEIDGGLQSAV
jgi:hypothetical protein